MFRLITGIAGPSGFGSASTAEQVTQGIDATNLTVLITGGASGIGFETARVLALRNAHVIIAGRNMKAANEAKQLILKDNKTARLDALKLDLASLKSVKAFANNFIALKLPLNILINNAGIMFCPYQLSEDGIEMQFATNHLGHFYLTNLLLDIMKETARSSGIEGRIINLTSVAHLHTYDEGIQFDKMNEETSYLDKKAYGQSKLANILHANELSRRLQAEGANITVNSVHPGLITTNLYRHSSLFIKILKFLTYILWKSIHQGAATTCYVALHPALKGVSGKYFLDCNEYESGTFARDEILAKRLWDFSNKLVDAAQNNMKSSVSL
ncbi:short-chain dehydrogenase TIC 32, chloroplastic-like [Olea europaea var. sylvestris]|uniref:Uncharacterized protein n=1 Tax=Olea europaea subsp. europaea TaxID=158383 RepID=A0A8S0PZB4_OLEEU|nr:short-chain dehydrogenase TIC 32, chloroplastic-like [Olea europaea var. sylvestris]CAA2957522.1 Hypothetical predicted protein [Olea europaea subsp. europaea]